MKATASTLMSLYVVFALLLKTTFATTKSYVVYMGAHPHDDEFTDDDDRDDRVRSAHIEFLGSFLESRDEAQDAIFLSYTKHINGFAATLSRKVASKLSKHPMVVSVFLNRGFNLHTTRSWDFLGLTDNGQIRADSLWGKARLGEDTIIGNLDTGVWPESKSFSDEGMAAIPSRWKGICEKDVNKSFPCNRKLIGARYFNKGYRSLNGSRNSTLDTPRDMLGHGSHTLSTAGGRFVPGANILGFGNGTAKGGSPRARVASYKVCWSDKNGCAAADILAAFDMAIHDGVDVLSVSLGGVPSQFYHDHTAIGSFHAVKHGIVVVASAGNSGPGRGTVSNVAPWFITVGASTMDRRFPSYVTFQKSRIQGESLSDTSLLQKKSFEMIYARNANAINATAEQAELCKAGTLDLNKVKGKILVCQRGDTPRVDKGRQAAIAGAVGMVLVNNQAFGNEIFANAHVLPATHISYKDGLALLSYINSTRCPMAKITKPTTKLGIKPAPVMTAFSSVGPNRITPEILKPDITAPGVSIIAAYTEALGPSGLNFDKRRVMFNLMMGTSMSCPHIAGVVGLLKTLYPSWSPAAIKSAIMTTASTLDNTLTPITKASNLKATPLNYGAGHVQPNLAMDPGLVYDLTTSDYLDFLCGIGYSQTLIEVFSGKPHNCSRKSVNIINMNYPSITVPHFMGFPVSVSRKVKNVGPPGTYKATVSSPPGISVNVEPDTLTFGSVGEEKMFNVKIRQGSDQQNGGAMDFVFGELRWSDGKRNVRSPIVIRQI